MNVLKKIPIAVGALCVGSYLAYQYVLNEEQRADMRMAAQEVRAATQEISDVISPLVKKGPTRVEEEAAIRANQSRTRDQWQQIGY